MSLSPTTYTAESIQEISHRRNQDPRRECKAENCYETVELGETFDLVRYRNGVVESFHLECFGAQFGVVDSDTGLLKG